MLKLNKLLITTSLLLISPFTLAEEAEDKRDFATTEVAPGIYMISGVGGFTGGNIGLSVGEDGVVMIDDSMPPLLDKIKKAIKTITEQPVDFLINTHVHGDHTGNNEAVGKDGTRIVAHENLRLNMLEKGLKTKDGSKPMPKAALPVITFSHAMNFHLNGEDVKIFHVAKAHTDGDAVIHYQNANVIHAGDALFNQMFPYIDLSNGGSIDGYIKAQKKIFELTDDKTQIIPGHGKLANKTQLKESIDMLIDSRNIISQLINEGKTEEEVVKANPLAKYHEQWNWFFITTEKMTRQIYKGLAK